jgi:hypothetical protein
MIGFPRLPRQTSFRLSHAPWASYSWKLPGYTRTQVHQPVVVKMASKLYIDDTPAEVKNAKVCFIRDICSRINRLTCRASIWSPKAHPTGRRSKFCSKNWLMHMEHSGLLLWCQFTMPVSAVSRTKYTRDISTNEQKKEWFLRLNPNGKLTRWLNTSGHCWARVRTNSSHSW